jgi:hypothetical protein
LGGRGCRCLAALLRRRGEVRGWYMMTRSTEVVRIHVQDGRNGSRKGKRRRSSLLLACCCCCSLLLPTMLSPVRPSQHAFSPPSPFACPGIGNDSPEAAIRSISMHRIVKTGSIGSYGLCRQSVTLHMSLSCTTSSQERFHPTSRSLSHPTETNGSVAVTPETHGRVRSVLSYPGFFVF